MRECEEIRQGIKDNIENLYDKVALLKGEQCLATLIKYYGEDSNIICDNLHVIKEYLDKNKNAGGMLITLD